LVEVDVVVEYVVDDEELLAFHPVQNAQNERLQRNSADKFFLRKS
jgi:hypothetical protein